MKIIVSLGIRTNAGLLYFGRGGFLISCFNSLVDFVDVLQRRHFDVRGVLDRKAVGD